MLPIGGHFNTSILRLPSVRVPTEDTGCNVAGFGMSALSETYLLSEQTASKAAIRVFTDFLKDCALALPYYHIHHYYSLFSVRKLRLASMLPNKFTLFFLLALGESRKM